MMVIRHCVSQVCKTKVQCIHSKQADGAASDWLKPYTSFRTLHIKSISVFMTNERIPSIKKNHADTLTVAMQNFVELLNRIIEVKRLLQTNIKIMSPHLLACSHHVATPSVLSAAPKPRNILHHTLTDSGHACNAVR